jgi:hypothetical protein
MEARMEHGVTWIVAADGAEARVFAEPVRSSPVRELESLRMSADGVLRAGRQQATAHGRMGFGRHGGGEADPRRAAERQFLKRVARRLALGAGAGAFDGLVLMGPPRAIHIEPSSKWRLPQPSL